MNHAVIQIAMRYVHIICAIIMFGGLLFSSIALKPALKLLDDATRDMFEKALTVRFTRVIWVCFAGLMVSGAYNWILLADDYKAMGPKGNAVIGIKVLLAVFTFIIILGRSIGFLRLSGKACHLINLHLLAIIVLLAALLRYWRLDG